jgi:hypothetical protein
MTVDARLIPSQTTTWLTPRWILDALGHFDLDPCCPSDMPWKTAEVMFTEEDDGLAKPWCGKVWLNPPYGRGIADWMRRMSVHSYGVALVFARTDASWFQNYVFGKARRLLFFNRRIKFCLPDGSPGGSAAASSVLAFYGAIGNLPPNSWGHMI